MRIQIDVRWPRFLRERPRWARFTVVGLVAAAIVAVPVAWASHDFTDVPDANPFHGDIAAIKRAGITSGKTCVPPGTPPTYCPTEGITREAMAAFIHRGFGRVARGTGADMAMAVFPAESEHSVLTINTGGVAGSSGFVYLTAQTNAYTSDQGCPCEVRWRIIQDGVGPVSDVMYGVLSDQVTWLDGSGYAETSQTGSLATVALVPTATTQTFRLIGQVIGTSTGSGAPVVNGYFARLTAVYAPFGSAGTDVLAPAGPDKAGGGKRPNVAFRSKG
jgi:hypothetical protein